MSPPIDDTTVIDTELVRRAAVGDSEAYGALVSRHQQKIWMICRSYLGPDDADAAAQDTFVKALTHIGSFNGRSSFTTWMTRIAINTCLDIIRRRKRQGIRVPEPGNGDDDPLDGIVDDQANPEERAVQTEAIARLGRAEQKLPDRQRTVFRLRYYAQMELEEIAATLDVHVGTVKTQLHRAVHKVRNELGDVR